MPQEIVSVLVSGTYYTAWEQVTVEASVQDACRSCTLRAAASIGKSATHAVFQVGAQIVVLASGAIIFTGYIDHRRPYLGRDSAYLTISARSKGQDAVDCSAVHKTGRFEKKTALEIAQELDELKIGFKSTAKLEKIPHFQLQPGETLFRAVERAARDEGVTLAGQADGGITFMRAGENAKRQAGALIEGINIHEASADFDGSNRFSEVMARGQSYDGHGKDALEMEEKVSDGGLGRKRPLILVQDGNTDKKRLKKRAENRRDKAAGNSTRATITVIGWRDQSGALWEPGRKVWTQSPFLGLAQDMLIEKVDYRQEGGVDTGTIAVLSLVDPRAHGGKAGKGAKSSSEWGLDTGSSK
jgi:prophage tail gpP-like protein